MMGFSLLLVVLATWLGGIIPVLFKKLHPGLAIYLLAFTGAFLFGITVMHLLPEVLTDLGHQASLYVVIGFFLQVFLQQLSHGLEHGHAHVPGEHSHMSVTPLFIGLSVHAFMEGIPLGFHYRDVSAMPSLLAGIAFHKIPEALTLMTVLSFSVGKRSSWILLLCFTCITPVAALLAVYLNNHFTVLHELLTYVVAIVIGAFLHISTTIFFESGTRHHELSTKKIIAIAAGLLLALGSLLLE